MHSTWSIFYAGLALSSLPFTTLASVTDIQLPENAADIEWHALASTNRQTLWLGSKQGHIARSEDGGEHWDLSRPAGTLTLPIAQIKAVSERQAFALTQGSGSNSRLYHTRNGGYSWNRVYRADGDEALRCFDLIPDAEAWILGNGLNDNWHVVRSVNGRRWLASRSGFDRNLQPGEGAFNQSASCVRYRNDTWAMGTSYGETARLMVKSTSALRFNVIDTPIEGASAAVTAVYPLANRDIIFTGGDLEAEDASAVIYRWQGQAFSELPSPPLEGVLTNLYVGDTIVVANDTGVAWSGDWGNEWASIDVPTGQLSCNADGCFALGQEGVIHLSL